MSVTLTNETRRPVRIQSRPEIHKAMRYTGRNHRAIQKWVGDKATFAGGALLLIDNRVVSTGDWVYEITAGPIRVHGIIQEKWFDEAWERIE